ncbi:MAG TPA: DNA-3-methyladenine glycosylase [Candidatus Omnitrophica bacterium]|nr:MAG: DNA-3-methyladenine glycosylase [Candidatus Omnitrophota bacterium]HEC70139.1 DNA-3-methyladenine glycosylase [Candidatus Omnitrophota bacterium]
MFLTDNFEKREWSAFVLKFKLKKDFYLQPAKILAPQLLGKILVVREKRSILAGKIVETEAYLGKEDPASHSYKGRVTPRNKIMYEEGGLIYVYLIYGKYFCFNIVVNKKNIPEAVFIRAVQPLEGIEIMRENNKEAKKLVHLTNGPCRWTKSFRIDKSFLGEKIYGDRIFIIDSPLTKKEKIVSAKRIGIDYAGKAKDWLLRFYIQDNQFVSKR